MPLPRQGSRQDDGLPGGGFGVVGIQEQHEIARTGTGEVRNASISPPCAWMKECAMVPTTGTPKRMAAKAVAVPAKPAM